jgi:hypothetical protein
MSIRPALPLTTIVPVNEDLFIPYLTLLYEDIASAVNGKDNVAFPMSISSTPTNIVNLPSFGSFIICVSGVSSSLPTLTASLCKASASASGAVTLLGAQPGTNAWSGFTLTITSTANNFQIAHDNTGVMGNFNLRIIGTQ